MFSVCSDTQGDTQDGENGSVCSDDGLLEGLFRSLLRGGGCTCGCGVVLVVLAGGGFGFSGFFSFDTCGLGFGCDLCL
jgi:hypothetical protein